MGFPGGRIVKNLSANAGDARDMGLIPGSGRSPGVGNGNPLQYSCLKTSMDRRAWWAIVHGVTKDLNTSQQLNNNNKWTSQRAERVNIIKCNSTHVTSPVKFFPQLFMNLR